MSPLRLDPQKEREATVSHYVRKLTLGLARLDDKPPPEVRAAVAWLKAEHRRKASVGPVPIGGDRARGKRLGYFQKRLEDGSLGYYMRRSDDCFRMAVATALQIQPHLVPDFRFDKQLDAGRDPEEIGVEAMRAFRAWLPERGLRMVTHTKVPAKRRRWIGIIPRPGDFNDHTLVCAGSSILHDPNEFLANAWKYTSADIAYGYSFTKEG